MDSSLNSPPSGSRAPASLKALAQDIAERLGPAWRLVSGSASTRQVHLIADHDQELVLSYPGSHRSRLQVRGRFPGDPRTWPHGLENPSSNLAVSRGAEAIAHHIRRHLLPRYTAALARVRTYQAQRAAEDARRHQLAGRFRAIWPGAWAGHSRWGGDRVTVLNWRGPDTMFATVTMRQEADDVDMELRLVPRELAVQIACLLAQAKSSAPFTAPCPAEGPVSGAVVAQERRAG